MTFVATLFAREAKTNYSVDNDEARMASLFAVASAEVQTDEVREDKKGGFALALLLAEFRILPPGNG
jgi:hypothetical protein